MNLLQQECYDKLNALKCKALEIEQLQKVLLDKKLELSQQLRNIQSEYFSQIENDGSLAYFDIQLLFNALSIKV